MEDSFLLKLFLYSDPVVGYAVILIFSFYILSGKFFSSNYETVVALLL